MQIKTIVCPVLKTWNSAKSVMLGDNLMGADWHWALTMGQLIQKSAKELPKFKSMDHLLKHVSNNYHEYFCLIQKRQIEKMIKDASRMDAAGRRLLPEGAEEVLKANLKLLEKKNDANPVQAGLFKQKREFGQTDLSIQDQRYGHYGQQTLTKYKTDGLHEKFIEINGEKVLLKRITIDKQFFITWGHCGDAYRKLKPHLNKLFKEFKALDKNNEDAVIEKAGEIYWLLANATPFRRGSAGIADVVQKILFESKGLTLPPYKPEIKPDCEAITRDLPDFLKNFKNMFDGKIAKQISLNG